MIRRLLGQTIVTPAWENALSAFEAELGWEKVDAFPTDPAWLQLHGFDLDRHTWTAIVRCPETNSGFVRLVEGDSPPHPRPFRRRGLFNAEIMVSDVEAAHRRLLSSSVFRPVSAPATYDMRETGAAVSRSFATSGPGGAGIYFTQILEVPAPRTVPVCPQLFSGLFNCAIAADAFEPSVDFYERTLEMSRRFDMVVAQATANQILGLDEDASFRMIVFKGEGDGLVEVDAHDGALENAIQLPGQLASGNAMLTLEATGALRELGERLRTKGRLVSPPQRIESVPYGGREVLIAKGPSDETVEVVASS